MANLFKLKTGAYRVTITRGERQKTIHLGKVNKKAAELVLSMIERIIASTAAGISLDAETARWTASIDDALHGKLVKAELLRQRQRRTLGKFIADYIEERSDWEPATLAAFRTATKKMIAYFGKDTSLENVAAEQCHQYKAELLRKHSQGYTAKQVERATALAGEFYTKRGSLGKTGNQPHCRIYKAKCQCSNFDKFDSWGNFTRQGSKCLFNAAIKRKLLTENPFADVIAGRHDNPDKMYFVLVGEAQALIDACNSPKQRLIIALARYGGLRCPSELVGLKWSEVNWERNRFIVHSPKTKKQGKAQRVVPIFKELYPFFRDAFEAAPEGVDRVYPEMTPKKSLGSFIEKTATRAGIELWEKPFQNMRSTRATELIEDYPAHVVNAWLGHTEAVAMAHYRQTGKAIDKFFEQAAGEQQKKVKDFTNEHAGIGCSGVEMEKTGIAASSCISTACNDTQDNAEGQKTQKWRGQDLYPTPQTPVITAQNAHGATGGGAEMGVFSKISPELRQIIDHWSTLPSEVKQTILTLVKHSRKHKTKNSPCR